MTIRLAYARPVRRILPSLLLPFLMCIAARAAQQGPNPEQVLAEAKSAAVSQHKTVFLVFKASWCPPCRQMEAFMEDSEIRPILEKYLVLASLNVFEERGKHPELNSPGAKKLVGDLGDASGTVPFLVFLDAQGQLVINSNRPIKGKSNGENIGYPALPAEIDWFMTMLQKTLPSLTSTDASTIENWLRKASR